MATARTDAGPALSYMARGAAMAIGTPGCAGETTGAQRAMFLLCRGDRVADDREDSDELVAELAPVGGGVDAERDAQQSENERRER